MFGFILVAKACLYILITLSKLSLRLSDKMDHQQNKKKGGIMDGIELNDRTIEFIENARTNNDGSLSGVKMKDIIKSLREVQKEEFKKEKEKVEKEQKLQRDAGKTCHLCYRILF